ncbi:unnamed protein product [Penicillium olsonii]|nr:unnamed protein product [Penicillium olsonii]CAG7925397.1 unnamed protein product [Penicillium olsonii]
MVRSPSPEGSPSDAVQAPKLSKSAKQDLILTHLRATGTCHTLKDLEKTLPAVASIPGIQVKEYIQALTDEGQVRVEKIGSGNWYWSFPSDEKRARESQLARVRTEVEKTRQACADAQALITEAGLRGEAEERDSLTARKAELQAAVDWVRTTEAQRGNSRSTLQAQLAGFRQEALQWTDNIYILEEYMRKLTGDRALVDLILQESYGEEYVDGGLAEMAESDQ